MTAKVSEETFKEATNEMMVIGELRLCWVESVAWKHFCNKVYNSLVLSVIGIVMNALI